MNKLFSYGITTTHRFLSTKTTQIGLKKKKYNPREKIKWTDQQSQILDAISNEKSVFISGSAGTGKTILLEHIIKQLKRIHGRSRVFATASTGVAACAINGQTLHSFAGIGLGEADRDTLLSRVFEDKKAYRRWNKVKALVIDEISMVDADFFDNLEYIANYAREDEVEYKDWGGIQLIVSGDFFQLPPITGPQDPRPRRFAFEADCWDLSFDLQVELTTVFRQSDPGLVKLLQGIRRGESDPDDLRLLEQRCCSSEETGSSVVHFYPRREDVDRVNRMQMERLNKETVIYRAIDSGEDRHWRNQLKHGIVPEEVELCVGARVMLCKNLQYWKKLVNGATGTVVDFQEIDDSDDDIEDFENMCEHQLLPIVEFDSGMVVVIRPEDWVVMDGEEVVAKRKQIPLVLAWALSIHKCQGMTLERIHTDLSRAFGFGMVYVALSRVKTLEGLHLSGFDASKIKAHPKVLEFYRRLASEEEDKEDDESETD